MRSPGSFVLLALLLATAAYAAEPVTAGIADRQLTLTFPASTLPGSVWVQLDGLDVPRRLARGRDPAVRWTQPNQLALDLHRVKRAIGTKWVSTARIWGQTRDGASLWQHVHLPGKAPEPAPGATPGKSCCCGKS
jgi:hypothetical protein